MSINAVFVDRTIIGGELVYGVFREAIGDYGIRGHLGAVMRVLAFRHLGALPAFKTMFHVKRCRRNLATKAQVGDIDDRLYRPDPACGDPGG